MGIPRNQDGNETDLEYAEISAGTASDSPSSGPKEEEMLPERFFNASDRPEGLDNYGQNESTLPAVNTFRAIQSDNEWMKRYIPDGHNSQIGNVSNKIEVTTEDSKKWYRLRIPYLNRFYNTEIYLVGMQNDYIYALRDEEKEMVCVRIL